MYIHIYCIFNIYIYIFKSKSTSSVASNGKVVKRGVVVILGSHSPTFLGPHQGTSGFKHLNGWAPKINGENNGKPYEQMDDLGRFPPIFGKHPYKSRIMLQIH